MADTGTIAGLSGWGLAAVFVVKRAFDFFVQRKKLSVVERRDDARIEIDMQAEIDRAVKTMFDRYEQQLSDQSRHYQDELKAQAAFYTAQLSAVRDQLLKANDALITQIGRADTAELNSERERVRRIELEAQLAKETALRLEFEAAYNSSKASIQALSDNLAEAVRELNKVRGG